MTDDTPSNIERIIRATLKKTAGSKLDIPAFLRRGTPENTKAIEEGAARLAAKPPSTQSTYKKKDRIAPTKTEKRRAKKSLDDVVRQQLLDADFSPKFVADLPITKAKQIVADLVAGKGCNKEDLI